LGDGHSLADQRRGEFAPDRDELFELALDIKSEQHEAQLFRILGKSTNTGKINANGGTVVLSAATAKNALQQAVNVPGSIRANSIGVRAGKIVLHGGDGGIVNVGGTLAANGGKRGNGGSITVAGAKISVPGKIAASGQKGGQIAVTSAGNLSVAGKVSAKGRAGEGGRIDLAGAKISVPGKIAASGQKGGEIAVTSTGSLSVAGKVSAKGRTGEGGRIDFAGKDIGLTGAKVNATGATGGGLVRIGGAFQGGKGDPSDPLYQAYVGRWGALPPIAAAQTVTVDAATKIDVSAGKVGDAGRPSFGRTKRHPLPARCSAQAEASPARAVTPKCPAKMC
jgi:mucin-19